MQHHATASHGSCPAIGTAASGDPQSNPYLSVSVSVSTERIVFLVAFRSYTNTRDTHMQLITSAEGFEKLPTPEGYFLDTIDLLTLERSCGSSEASRRVACMLSRSPNELSALCYLIVTATGELYPVPQEASSDVLNLADWRVIYSHNGIADHRP